MKEELKKLGLRVRQRPAAEKPGTIAFDDRGNARFQWSDDRLASDSDTGERLRDKALNHPGLSIADDESPSDAPVRINPKGLRLGYNPYESGLLPNKAKKGKRDLRELSRWIDMKRKLSGEQEEK